MDITVRYNFGQFLGLPAESYPNKILTIKSLLEKPANSIVHQNQTTHCKRLFKTLIISVSISFNGSVVLFSSDSIILFFPDRPFEGV